MFISSADKDITRSSSRGELVGWLNWKMLLLPSCEGNCTLEQHNRLGRISYTFR